MKDFFNVSFDFDYGATERHGDQERTGQNHIDQAEKRQRIHQPLRRADRIGGRFQRPPRPQHHRRIDQRRAQHDEGLEGLVEFAAARLL